MNESKTFINQTLKSLDDHLEIFNKQLNDYMFDKLTESIHKLLDEKFQKFVNSQKNCIIKKKELSVGGN